MNINVKILKGRECTVKISPSDSIQKLKELIAVQMDIPVGQQKLVYQGKNLSDEKTINSYQIPENGKVFLVTKKSDETPSPSSTAQSSHFYDKLRLFLCRHFTDSDADLVLTEFKKDFENRLNSLSLDDIERLATIKLFQAKKLNSS
ncbi:4A [Octopus vulgaris]|uniref:4A n=3 Tax=Octopus TaxID=6643 RepID=A0AA36AGG5_OCTVU|nr:ubiquitin-like protein 4A [Octopus bimaculoides]XP_029645386.1 ubiquitin-like protein 4A [Octopus sinensis]CAI9715710.1 4A [Octopus vulgaris]|eukprot:XP_014779819.1 PREDICTED: ubiquitin-like protein 4A [Octopus bimaculoides]